MSALSSLLTDLVIANRVLANEGVLDAFGHVSVRHPDDPGRYFIPRSRSPELIALDDLVECTLDGTPVKPETRSLYAERAIHGAVYETRPDVFAICHNHADPVIPFSITAVPLRPVMHVAALIGEQVPVWDIADDHGDATDVLVRTLDQGRSLARTLGDGSTALMRGHGSVVAGASLVEVVMTAIYLAKNASLQQQAAALGGPIKFLSKSEIENAARMHRTPMPQARAWEYWRTRAGFSGI